MISHFKINLNEILKTFHYFSLNVAKNSDPPKKSISQRTSVQQFSRFLPYCHKYRSLPGSSSTEDDRKSSL